MLGIVRQTLKRVSGNPWKKMELKSLRWFQLKDITDAGIAAVLRKGLIATFSAMTAGNCLAIAFIQIYKKKGNFYDRDFKRTSFTGIL